MNRSGLVRRIPCQSGSEWNGETVSHFNIKVERERSFEEFFGVQPPQVFSAEINEFLALDLRDVVLGSTTRFINHRFVKLLVKHIIAVTKTHRHEESAVDDMSAALLKLFEYDADDLSVRSRSVLDLFMSNAKTQAIPDVLVERLDTAVKMLVQEDKSYDDRNLKNHNPEAQLVAEAIAAYQENRRLYDRLGMDEFPDFQLLPGITILGTCPTFYLIPVTKELADSVKTGEQSSSTTTVKKFMISDLPANISDAILSQLHRLQIVQCFEAFKRFL